MNDPHSEGHMASYIGRRKFLATFLGGAAAWPLAARAQQAGKLPTIGFLVPNTRAAASEWTDAFVQRLGELGWIEGRTVTIEYRWAEGRPERFAEVAAEFVRRNVDVIVTAGLVTSLSRPGGNVTGLSNVQIDLAGKRLELLREIVPNLRRLAILVNVGHPASVLEMDE